MRTAKGFTLIELMIVVAIIAIIAAVAIPSLLRSRMTANETAAIASCRAFSEAEEIFHRTDYDGDGVLEYATKMSGTFSLLETAPGTDDLTLIDKAFASAEGDPGTVSSSRAGYVFTILTSQGAAASAGAKLYINAGNMIYGFAMSALPAAYDGTGRNNFIINNAGTTYQGDLGSAVVAHPTSFNPTAPTYTPAQ
jgi:prepilin-type N-terminal cleavage/methylation domain-containing protein